MKIPAKIPTEILAKIPPFSSQKGWKTQIKPNCYYLKLTLKIHYYTELVN